MKQKFLQAQQGQSLIETVVALGIMVTGVSAVVALANFSYASSINLQKRIIATALAREGLEAVKNMRDTNWLAQRSINMSTTCYDYVTSSNTAGCYSNWLSQKFCLDPDTSGGACTGISGSNFTLGLNSATNDYWLMVRLGSTKNYGLNLDLNNTSGLGIYNIGTGTGVACGSGTADYCRKIVITKDLTAPFNQNEGPKIKVQSLVWWKDKNCALTLDWPGAGKCALELDTFLTNWKDY